MNDSAPTTTAVSEAGCPFHAKRTIPTDGTPLAPSPTLAAWRDEAAATPLHYSDGHDGLIVTRHELARLLLEDPTFSQQPQRMPGESELGSSFGPGVDDRALAAMEVGNLLGLDSPQHARIRRTILGRFSVRSARGYQADVAAIVARQLEHLRAQGSPADLTKHFAQPISAAVHCRVLGIPPSHAEQFSALYVEKSTTEQKIDFLREVLDVKRAEPGEDVLSELLKSDLTTPEVEGVTAVLFGSGRDSVAYMIATSTVALLSHPDQLEALRDDPSLISGAIEEFMRFGAMFITLFPRTATENVDFGDVQIRAGQSVSVSPVAANRDERRFENPERFDITRDAFGHLGFGHGIHGCVGQQVARLEIREAITQMLAGLPGLFLVEAEQTEPMPFAHPVATYEAGAVIVGWR
ncbi:cytochrome P450 [Lacisediminihabitans sp.]|uniref:cytochrome P450 n=1 Tax=Lacisediminihabitans sp. TaxID=2787631 RepID=UPI00374CC6CE